MLWCLVSQSSPNLRPCGLQHARLPCPSLSPRVYSNSCPVMPSNHLILCCHLLLLLSIFPSIRVFCNESALHIRWPKYWISLSNEYVGLISFRIDWFDILEVQGTLESLLQHCRPYRDAYQSLSVPYFQLCAWNSHEGIRSKLDEWQELARGSRKSSCVSMSVGQCFPARRSRDSLVVY